MTTHVDRAALRRQIFFWLIALAMFAFFLYVFSSILLPFVAGMALGYFLDPVADRLQKLGMSRLAATALILLVFVVMFIASFIIIIPLLVTQAADFASKVPGYFENLQHLVTTSAHDYMPDWLAGQIEGMKNSFSGLIKEGAGFLGSVLQQIWNSGKSIVDVVALLVVTPVVAFYLLLDWDDMVAKIDAWIPRDHVDTVRELARRIDRTVAGFIRGQGTVCMVLGLFYGIALSIAGLNFGLLIGLFAGLISFIPYVGSTIGLVLAFGVALVQFWPDYIMIGVVLGIFFIGQFLEGNILQPRLVGSSVGLHPVWLMFALFAFGALFGFVGMLVAVPAAAALGVLVRFALEKYLDSDLYHGQSRQLLVTETKRDDAI
ncbi:AI-2E family transporter [Pseudohoeflea suaedae]|uniref:AI-2E family transporter n=1 Tax=Pseudohoeflea suaedae TaxID=877384 RepID=A0A4R5PPE7_9HYPH|nr:AI-2E family transporter [Pseudohoeflea suaedae]TDH38926.1 AI-2E family transporter [Pseudohoeflea suaedae]